MKLNNIIYVFFVLLFAACGKPKGGEKTLIILSTNDMHAKIENYAKVAAYVEKIKSENKHVLLLSGGDMFSGNPIVDQYSDNGYPMIDIMNKIGYQFAVLGNHEFDYGQEILNKRIAQADFSLLCANVECAENAVLKQPKPYVNLSIDGLKICILATIQTHATADGRQIPSAHPSRLENLIFTPAAEVAVKYKNLRNDCDLFVGLMHNGVEIDVELAQQMPELDVIIGGHSHTRIDTGMLVNGVLITQAECYLKYIGKTTIVFDGNKIKSKKYELVDVEKLTDESADIKNLIEKYYETSGLNEVVAHARYDLIEKEVLGCLMTDAITNIHKVDFAFQNSGGVRIKKIPKGDITLAKIYELDPFGNEVIVFEMTPAEIKSLIANSYRKGNKYADLLVSGMTYTIKTKDGKAVDVAMRDMNGKELDANKKYKVGMNSYISSSYKFDHADEGHSLYVTSAETLIDYLKQQKEVQPAKRRTNIQIVQ